jgi:hypothetical protein
VKFIYVPGSEVSFKMCSRWQTCILDCVPTANVECDSLLTYIPVSVNLPSCTMMSFSICSPAKSASTERTFSQGGMFMHSHQ